MTKHWHVAYGIAGYGPDGVDGFLTATEIRGPGGLADLISTELQKAAEASYQEAEGLSIEADKLREQRLTDRELEALRAYQEEMQRTDTLSTLSANFSINRESAPLYTDNPALWEENVLRLVAKAFPCNISSNERLYVWECEEGGRCEHLQEYEQNWGIG